MHRMLSSLVFLLVATLSAPAMAGSRPVMSGDPAIDSQWAAQGAGQAANPAGYAPVDPWASEPTGIFRAFRGSGSSGAAAAAPAPARSMRARALAPAPQPRRTIDPAYLPAVINDPTGEAPGTIVIDTHARYLYLVEPGGKAERYGVGVGREGFGWQGTVHVGRKAEWPTWTPPAEMRKRQPYLPISMAGGPDNPLGARAMYLYDGGRDTLFRIHGSNQPWTIGHAVSSGCIRMRNEDVTALYERVKIGTKVVVK